MIDESKEEKILKQVDKEKYEYIKKLNNICEQIENRLLKCPHCKGHYIETFDDDGNTWWKCNKEYEKHIPTKARQKIIDKFMTGDLEFEVIVFSDIIREDHFTQAQKTDFTLKFMDTVIEKLEDIIMQASDIKLFSALFRKFYKTGEILINMDFEPEFDTYLVIDGKRLRKNKKIGRVKK